MTSKDFVLEKWPFAVAIHCKAHNDWAVFTSSMAQDCIGFGTLEGDAWLDAKTRIKIAQSKTE